MTLRLVCTKAAEMNGLTLGDSCECLDDMSGIGSPHFAAVTRRESRKTHSAALVLRNEFTAGGQQWQPHIVTRPGRS